MTTKPKICRLIFEGLTPLQAKTLAEWFEGQGEQDCGTWFEENDMISPRVDMEYPGGWMQIETNGDVHLRCIT